MTSSRHRRCYSFSKRVWAGLAVLWAAAGCDAADALCEQSGCQFSDTEWERLSSLAGLGVPDPDPANDYVASSTAAALGRRFYHDPRFSGLAAQTDNTGRLVSQPARAPIGEPVNISCATCHDLRRAGTDSTSVPGHVSVGAGWYDVNAQSTVNAAFYPFKYWNGRYESLVWQIASVAESTVSMNGTRLAIVWQIHEHYRPAYQAVFGRDYPLPNFGRTRAQQAALLEPDGQCRLVDRGGGNLECPAEFGCRIDRDSCWPRWPLNGKPGQPEFDRMDAADRRTITRVYVNWAKAIAAFEYQLISGVTPFDRWIEDGPDSELISVAARRGARLFVGKAACIDCHNTPLFSDSRFHNIGVPQRGVAVPTESDCNPTTPSCVVYGWHLGLTLIQEAGAQPDENRRFRNDGPWSDNPDAPPTQFSYDAAITDNLRGQWRTASLREVARTSPYMHSGFYRSLEEVIDHYNRGGTQEGAVPENLSPRLRPLGLTDSEVSDLVAFLETLNGEPLPRRLSEPPELPE